MSQNAAAETLTLTEEQLDVLNIANVDSVRRDYVAVRHYGIKAANQLLKMGLLERFESAVRYPGSKYDRMLVFFKATAAGATVLKAHGLCR